MEQSEIDEAFQRWAKSDVIGRKVTPTADASKTAYEAFKAGVEFANKYLIAEEM